MLPQKVGDSFVIIIEMHKKKCPNRNPTLITLRNCQRTRSPFPYVTAIFLAV